MTGAARIGAVWSSASPDADAWEDPPRRPPASTSPVLTVEGFESPLDWLLEMARWVSWTVMATQLAEMRPGLLLPMAGPDAKSAQTEAEARHRHGLRRAEMLAAADWLERQPQLGRDVFARGRPEPAWTGQGTNPGRATGSDAYDDDAAAHDGEGLAQEEEHDDLTKLLRACLVALRLPA